MWFFKLSYTLAHKQCTNFKLSKQSCNAHKCFVFFFNYFDICFCCWLFLYYLPQNHMLIVSFVCEAFTLSCIHIPTLSSYTNCPGLHGSSLHAQVDIRSRGNASNVINDADDDFLISQIISQNMLATVWVCFDPHPIPRRKQGEHSVRMLIIQ